METKKLIEEYENYMVNNKGRSASTIRGYKTDIKQFVQAIGNPINANRKMVLDYFGAISKEYASASIERKVAAVQSLWAFMLDYGYVAEDITRKIPVPKKKKALITCPETSEVENIINNEPLDSVKIAIQLGAFTGLRVSEVCNLRAEDVDYKNFTIRLYDTKTEDETEVMVDEQTMNNIKKYMFKNKIFSGELLKTTKGKPWKERNLHKYLQGRFDFTFHSFRHHAATELANKVGVHVAMNQLRHRNVRTTMSYIHPDKRTQLEALNSLRR